MSKAVIIAAVTFVVLGAGLYIVLSNSHVDIFPGTEHSRSFETGKIEEESATVSLLDVARGIDSDGEGAELTTGGYVVAVLVIVILPAVIAGVVFWLLAKKASAESAPPPAAQ